MRAEVLAAAAGGRQREIRRGAQRGVPGEPVQDAHTFRAAQERRSVVHARPLRRAQPAVSFPG